jgi:cob(I)alamin adenosyltransferase
MDNPPVNIPIVSSFVAALLPPATGSSAGNFFIRHSSWVIHHGAVSIVTKTGDGGTTGLMYGRRVPKNDPRVEACGTLDELNAALGMARATAGTEFVSSNLLWIQKNLVDVMGEVGVLPADLPRYAQDGYRLVTPELTARLEALVKEIEAQNISFKGWATPGATPHSAALDVARTICRRAERRVYDLHAGGALPNAEIMVFLNRLSDLLWLLARWAETQAPSVPCPPP